MRLSKQEQWRKFWLVGGFLGLILSGGGSTWLSLLYSSLALLFAYGCFPLSSRLPLWICGLHVAGLGVWLLPLPEGLQPPWKETLRELGASIPSRTAVEVSSMLVSVGHSTLAWLWMAWILGQLQSKVSRRAVAAWGSRLLTGLAILVLFAESNGFRLPWNQFAHHFSFFANRNQSALLFVVGGVFCLGQFLATYQQGILHRLEGLFSTAFCLMAAGLYGSRAALLLAALALVFLLWRSWRHGAGLQSGIIPTLGLIFFILLLLFGEIGLRRLFPTEAASPAGFWDEQRTVFYADSFRIWRDHAWLGVGPGHFRFLYPLYAGGSRLESEPLHPESSFWLCGTESGGTGAILALLLFWLFRREYPLRLQPVNAYHSSAGVAAMVVIVLHGLVDVSWHRAGIACLFAFAWGMLVEKKNAPTSVSSLPAIASAGLPVLLLFGAFILAPDAEGREGWQRLFRAPLLAGKVIDWRSHYERGRQSLSQGRWREARKSFRLAAHLSGQHPEVTLRIGAAWLPLSPKTASAVWLEGMRRSTSPEEADRYFRRVFSWSRSAETMADFLPEACRHPRWLATWMENASSAEWMLLLERRDICPLPPGGENDGKRLDLLLWRRLPDLPAGYFDRLAVVWPSLLHHAWRARSLSLWSEARYEEALSLLAAHLPEPFPEETVFYREPARFPYGPYSNHPGDILAAKSLLHFYYENGEWSALLEVAALMDRFINLQPSWKLLSQFQAAKALKDHQQAWTAAQRYIREYDVK